MTCMLCAMRGRVPAMQKKEQDEKDMQMVVRLPLPLYERLREIAREEERTVSAEVRWLMQRRVEERA